MSADMYVCQSCGKLSYSYWDCSECGFKMHTEEGERQAKRAALLQSGGNRQKRREAARQARKL